MQVDDWEVALRCRAAFVWQLIPSMTSDFPDSPCKSWLDQVFSTTASATVRGSELEPFLERVMEELRAWVIAAKRTDLAPLVPEETPTDAIQDLFLSLLEQVDDLYAPVGGTIAEATLNIEEYASWPSDERYFVQGEFGATTRIVRLFVEPVRFDWRSLVAVAPVLMHELICHAGAGHTTSGRQLFSEAVMDQVSTAFLIRWASRLQLPRTFINQLFEAVSDLQRARRNDDIYREGRFAHRTLRSLVKMDARTDRRSASFVTDRLLLALNAHPGVAAAKDRLASDLASWRGAAILPGTWPDLVVRAALANAPEERQPLIDELLSR